MCRPPDNEKERTGAAIDEIDRFGEKKGQAQRGKERTGAAIDEIDRFGIN